MGRAENPVRGPHAHDAPCDGGEEFRASIDFKSGGW